MPEMDKILCCKAITDYEVSYIMQSHVGSALSSEELLVAATVEHNSRSS